MKLYALTKLHYYRTLVRLQNGTAEGRLSTSRRLLNPSPSKSYPSSKARWQSSSYEVASVSDVSRELSTFPKEKLICLESIIGKGFQKV